jgi:uncharacterized alpha-E superfamily protein
MTSTVPGSLLLARVAENAYWAGRYLERAEGTARLIRSHSDLIIDLPRNATVGWAPLLAVLGLDLHSRPDPTEVTESQVVALLAADPNESSSVLASIEAVHRNLRVARPVMPIEAGEVLADLHRFVTAEPEQAVHRRTRSDWLTTVIRYCQTLSGVLSETMSHDDAYGFFVTGRQLERADMTSRVLDVQANLLTTQAGPNLAPYLDISWFAALRSVSALEAFRRSGRPDTVEAKIAFLLRDLKCPRTVEACVVEASRWLLELPRHSDAMQRCAALQTMLEEIDPDSLGIEHLHGFADELQAAIGEIHNAIASTWFHTPEPVRS